MAEKLTKTEEYERAVKSSEINQHRLNVILKRIPEIEAELQDAVVKQEIKGYAANTIKRLRDELNQLRNEKDGLEFSISAMQKALPELKKQADIERAATEGVDKYMKTKEHIQTVLSDMPDINELKNLTQRYIDYVNTLHTAKKDFYATGKGLFDFMQQHKLNELSSITENQLRQDRQNVSFNTVHELCEEIEKIADMLTEVKFSLYAAITSDLNTQLPPPFDPETVEQVSECGRFMRKKSSTSVWKMFELNKTEHPLRIFEGRFKPAFPTKKDLKNNWIIEPEK